VLLRLPNKTSVLDIGIGGWGKKIPKMGACGRFLGRFGCKNRSGASFWGRLGRKMGRIEAFSAFLARMKGSPFFFFVPYFFFLNTFFFVKPHINAY
jgi:hypothetical protein